MLLISIEHIALIFAFTIPTHSIPNLGGLDYSDCAKIANETYLKAPNNSFLYNQQGEPTGDSSQAWGISYQACVDLCTTEEEPGIYNWGFISSGIASWFLPWLALNAQLPFATKDKTTNFIALLLAVGSPSLITYSLALTIFNARWINRTFRHIKEINATLHRPLQLKVIKAARAILIETQHIPIHVYNGRRREIAQLVVHPHNWNWWCSLRDTILLTKRKWTYSLYAQVGFVCVSQVLAITVFFTSASSNSSIGIGLAINSLWLWMIPVVLGWVYVGTQTDSNSIKAALTHTNVPVLGLERNVSGECIGIRDRTTFDDLRINFRDSSDSRESRSNRRPQQQQDSRSTSFAAGRGIPITEHGTIEERMNSESSQTTQNLQPLPKSSADHLSISHASRSDDIEMKDLAGDFCISNTSTLASTLRATEQQSQPLLDLEETPMSCPQTFLGFSVAGDDLEPGPIFNYARVRSHMNTVKHVAEAFLTFTKRQKAQIPVVSGKKWTSNQDYWDENLQGTAEEMSRYTSPLGKDVPNIVVHAPASTDLVLNCITAAFVAIFLQWGTTGAAIIIDYKFPHSSLYQRKVAH